MSAISSADHVGFENVLELLQAISARINYKRCVLSFSHSDYRTALGGTEKVMHQEQALLRDRRISYIQIFPVNIGAEWIEPEYQLLGLNVDSEFIGRFTASCLGRMLGLLVQSGVTILQIHIHHLMGIGIPAYLHATKYLKVETYLFIHDYYTACPQVNFLQNDESFCGAPPVASAACNSCRWGTRRTAHVNAFRSFIADFVHHIIAPSEVAKRLWGQTFPELVHKVMVIPHLLMEPDYPNEIRSRSSKNKVRIAYVGYQQFNKGWNSWRRVVSIADPNRFEFFHLGACHTKMEGVSHVDVSFLTDGLDAMQRTLSEHEIDVAFLWSICPETYSFTLYESIAAGCYIVTNRNSGNIAEQVREHKFGDVMSDDDELLRTFSEPDRFIQRVRYYLHQAIQYKLHANPYLADELASRAGEELLNTSVDVDATKQAMELSLVNEGMKISRELEQIVLSCVEQQRLIEYLQMMHAKKDAAIEDLRARLAQTSIASVIRERVRHKVSRHAWLKQVLTRIVK
ncbi:MAG: glycosyltransferase [Alicyclobacillus sp.]|nr:glycosyltransferase [Alicyclobacillus sp.]